MEKHVLIVENSKDSLIKESVQNSTKFLLKGIFTEFDIENRNKRFYKAENFIPCMQALLEKRKMLGVLYGEFDHPDVFDIAGKNASHAIESLTHNENSNRVDGSIALLTTHFGKEARAIINDGYPLFVSSRAAGVTDGNGCVALKELFTYDIVLDPGFASARVSVNESFGYNTAVDVPYRIYEMKDEQVNKLFNDNKNDSKTKMDLKQMEMMLATEMAKLEHQILTKVSSKSNPEEVKSLMENYGNVKDEMSQVKEYLNFLQTKVSYLVKENTSLKTNNTKMLYEMNENVAYSNHLSSQLKNLNKYTIDIEKRLTVDEKMIEYVAEHAKANILFSEDIAVNVTKMNENIINNTEFLNYVATETEIAQNFAEQFAKDAKAEIELTQKFAEQVATETELTQKFAEQVATETELAQKFSEYIAEEKHKDEIFLNYVANKVDGIVAYNEKIVTTLKSTTPVNENATGDTIHKVENIVDFLGIQAEREISNNIETLAKTNEDAQEVQDAQEAQAQAQAQEAQAAQEVQDAQEAQVQPVQVQPVQVQPVQAQPVQAQAQAQAQSDINVDPSTTNVLNQDIQNTEIPMSNVSNVVTTADVVPMQDIVMDADNETPAIETDVQSNMGTSLISALVKILGSDDTGIIMEITPDNKMIIQKSGSDDTVTLGKDEYEVINTDDNITQTVESVLTDIKKQKVLANQQPHFYSFLSEQQINDFKHLDNQSREAIVLAMNESEYFDTTSVLKIIGNTLNEKVMNYEERIVGAIPTPLKESWNNLSQDQKVSILTESKYFSLVTTADASNFWNTRTFAKAVLSPEATMIKESASLHEDNNLSDDYVNAFLKSVNNLG